MRAADPAFPACGRGIARGARGAHHPYPHLDGEHPAPAIPTRTTDFGAPEALNTSGSTSDNGRMVVAGRPPASAPESDEFAATVAAASRGSAPECRALYDAHAGRVCGYLRFNGATDPDDLTSEVFLRVFNHLDDFSGTQDGFRAGLHHRTPRAHRRAPAPGASPRHRRARAHRRTSPSSGATPSSTRSNASATSAFAELLARLTPDQRDVIALRIIADLPINEVADVLGKEPGTIKALQHRAIARAPPSSRNGFLMTPDSSPTDLDAVFGLDVLDDPGLEAVRELFDGLRSDFASGPPPVPRRRSRRVVGHRARACSSRRSSCDRAVVTLASRVRSRGIRFRHRIVAGAAALVAAAGITTGLAAAQALPAPVATCRRRRARSDRHPRGRRLEAGTAHERRPGRPGHARLVVHRDDHRTGRR